MKKICLALLYGGCSPEHEISCYSVRAIAKKLDPSKFVISPIYIDKTGFWIRTEFDSLVSSKSLYLENHLSQFSIKEDAITCLSHCQCDVIFPVLHGILGEDGTLQGLLEWLDLPYVGAGLLNSALGMEKDVAKRLVCAASVPIGPYITFNKGQWERKADHFKALISTDLSYPVFVKPVNAGSSIGINKVQQAQALESALEEAFQYDSKILVEKALEVREIELSVLENLDYGSDPLVSIPGEIKPSDEFYSYKAKYLGGDSELIIPAPLEPKQVEEARNLAGIIFTQLGGSGMARVDLFLEKSSEKFYFNEINTIPGFTDISMYPKLWEASGISFQKLLDHLIKLALERHQRRGKFLNRSMIKKLYR